MVTVYSTGTIHFVKITTSLIIIVYFNYSNNYIIYKYVGTGTFGNSILHRHNSFGQNHYFVIIIVHFHYSDKQIIHKYSGTGTYNSSVLHGHNWIKFWNNDFGLTLDSLYLMSLSKNYG